jgi:hypothetical protein
MLVSLVVSAVELDVDVDEDDVPVLINELIGRVDCAADRPAMDSPKRGS